MCLADTELAGFGMASLLCAVGFGITAFFGGHFTPYEQIWFLSILVLASVFSVLFPEEDVNGVFILLRLREQWIAWYISAIPEAAMNILAGQYVLLVFKAGYLTNTTYVYIRWTKYINKLAAKDK